LDGKKLQEEASLFSPETPQYLKNFCSGPRQCIENCSCQCPYNPSFEVEQLPLIAGILPMFPNEWLAFIIPREEDGDYEPTHGQLIAHSPNPDEVYDVMKIVPWKQYLYLFFNGSFEAMQISYGRSSIISQPH
jgi:hypothetical protein